MIIRKILDILRVELEVKYIVERSSLKTLNKSMLGTTGDSFYFESSNGTFVSIEYWDSGIIIIESANVPNKVDYLFFDFTPVDYQNKIYPKESEEIFVEKINELLGILHKENPNVMPRLPVNI